MGDMICVLRLGRFGAVCKSQELTRAAMLRRRFLASGAVVPVRAGNRRVG